MLDLSSAQARVNSWMRENGAQFAVSSAGQPSGHGESL